MPPTPLLRARSHGQERRGVTPTGLNDGHALDLARAGWCQRCALVGSRIDRSGTNDRTPALRFVLLTGTNLGGTPASLPCPLGRLPPSPVWGGIAVDSNGVLSRC